MRQCRKLSPDVVVMDIRMPVQDGIAAPTQIAAEGLARVLVLTTFHLDEYVIAALRAGASGFLLKDVEAAKLAEAIRVIASGHAAELVVTETTVKTHVHHLLTKLGARDRVQLVRAPAAGYTASAAKSAIQAAMAGYPGAQLLDQTGYIASQTAMLNSLLTLVTAMLILAIVIALLGVVNTLALSISERTREIGLLRAVGMRRGQVRQMVAAESMIISVIGALLGTMVGIGLGVALAVALTRSPQATVAIPAGQLLFYVVATAAAGVLASIAPARRAARLDMLTAIATE